MRFNPQAGPPGWFLAPVARRLFKWSATHTLLKIMLSLRSVSRSDVPCQGTCEALELEGHRARRPKHRKPCSRGHVAGLGVIRDQDVEPVFRSSKNQEGLNLPSHLWPYL